MKPGKTIYRVFMKQVCKVSVIVRANDSYHAQELAQETSEFQQDFEEIVDQEVESVEEIGQDEPERDTWLDR